MLFQLHLHILLAILELREVGYLSSLSIVVLCNSVISYLLKKYIFTYFEYFLHKLYLFILNWIMNKGQHFNKSIRGNITLWRYIHQKVHKHFVHFYLRYILQKLCFSFFIHSLIDEKLSWNTLEKCDWVIVESLMLTSKIYSIYQTNISFF